MNAAGQEKIRIAVSILSADLTRLGEHAEEVLKEGVVARRDRSIGLNRVERRRP